MHRAPRAHQQLIILHCLSHAEIVHNALLSVHTHIHLFSASKRERNIIYLQNKYKMSSEV